MPGRAIVFCHYRDLRYSLIGAKTKTGILA